MKDEELINNLTGEILKYIGAVANVQIIPQEENIFAIDIQGNNLSYLIGYQGESLNAMQSILSLMVLKKLGKPAIISLDINNYKGKKIEKIIEMTKNFIDKVRFFEKEVPMPPMSPWERRQVHTFVAEYTDIISESTGEGPSRRVVLKPKKR